VSLKPYQPRTFTLEDAAHLARRTSFGATEQEIRALHALGPQGAVDRLLRFPAATLPGNPFDPSDGATPGAMVKLTQARWLYEMIHTPHPLREKLALTWHNHFVIGTDKVRNIHALAGYLEVLRTRSLGRFEQLTLAVAQSPAMLRYLDNDQNKKGKPNENFARELLELFTTGIGHYTEQDVQEAARALTGWTYVGGRGKEYDAPVSFVFNARQHDGGVKTYLGQRGNFQGEDVIRISAAHPATGDFVAGKLLRAFVTDNPRDTDVKAVGDLFRASAGDLHEVTRALLTSELFYAPPNRNAIIKSPVEFVVGALRAMDRPPLEEKAVMNLVTLMARMGQELLHPPTVKGWDGGREWINDTTLLLRMQFAAGLTLGRTAVKRAPGGVALLGTERSPLRGALTGLNAAQQTYLTLISPEYALA